MLPNQLGLTAPRRSVFAVRFSGDGVYVFSGSEDMNVRIWKAEASAQIGPVRALLRLCFSMRRVLTAPSLQMLPREKKKAAYDAALVARYAHVPEVKRIARYVHAPASSAAQSTVLTAL